MNATTDILQPTPPRGSMKKYSETQPEVEKCHSEPSEEPKGYPHMASEPSETAPAPSAIASEPSETVSAPSATASEHSAGFAAPSGRGYGQSAVSAGYSDNDSEHRDTETQRVLNCPPKLGATKAVTDSSPKLGEVPKAEGSVKTAATSAQTDPLLTDPLGASATPPNLGEQLNTPHTQFLKKKTPCLSVSAF